MFSRFTAKLSSLLPDLNKAPLLHGDIWGGNVMCIDKSQALFIDPAIYHGHHEVDLAFSEMFNSFGKTFYDAYNEIKPISKDYYLRKDIYNIYPNLCHFNLFNSWGYFENAITVMKKFI